MKKKVFLLFALACFLFAPLYSFANEKVNSEGIYFSVKGNLGMANTWDSVDSYNSHVLCDSFALG